MSFNPTSTIYLTHVDFDSTYNHSVYFENGDSQFNYFLKNTPRVKTLSDYLTVRRTAPNGNLQTSIKVDINIDAAHGYNYMFYQNENHGNKWFYAFITSHVYINEATTELIFETDVIQTWLFDTELLPSFVEREHSVTDNPGDNIIPESFNCAEYTHRKLNNSTLDDLTKLGYLIGSSEHYEDQDFWEETFGGLTVNGRLHSGIYQGVYFYYFTSVIDVNRFLATAMGKNEECILFITALPQYNMMYSQLGVTGEAGSSGFVGESLQPVETLIDFGDVVSNIKYEDYTPKNNKMYTAPYYQLMVTNHSGQTNIYKLEDFTTRSIGFRLYGDVSATPSIMMVPELYKGIQFNVDEAITLTNFPQASFITDTYKMWLNKNQGSLGVSTIASMAQLIGGIAITAGTGGAGAAVGVGMIASGASGMASTIGNTINASNQANTAKIDGSGISNLLTAAKQNKIDVYVEHIKPEFAKMIDDYFTIYGYAQNVVKVPERKARKVFTYTKTMDCNAVGRDVPEIDLRKIKSIYDKGITFWQAGNQVGNYDVDNSVIL